MIAPLKLFTDIFLEIIIYFFHKTCPNNKLNLLADLFVTDLIEMIQNTRVLNSRWEIGGGGWGGGLWVLTDKNIGLSCLFLSSFLPYLMKI
jgi:hypothetical protein